MVKLLSIFKPSNSKYYNVEFLINEKRHRKSLKVKSKDKAYKAWEKIARSLDSSDKELLNNMPLVEAMEDFLEDRRHKLQPSSFAPERIKLNSFLRYMTGNQSIINVSDTTIDNLDKDRKSVV